MMSNFFKNAKQTRPTLSQLSAKDIRKYLIKTKADTKASDMTLKENNSEGEGEGGVVWWK